MKGILSFICLALWCTATHAGDIIENGAELGNIGDRQGTGTIVYYPQDHRLFEGRFAEYSDGSDFCEDVAKCQFKILRQLKSWGCRVVFSEEHLKRMSRKDVDPTDLRTVLFYFDEGIPRRVNDLQKAVLYEYGAAFVYMCLEEQVYIYPTIRPEDHMFIDMVVQHALEQGKDLPLLAFDDREVLALEEIQSYLALYPGRKVALIYGYRHRFLRHLNEEFNPKFLVCR